MEFKERSGWVLRKPYAPAFGFKNTHLLPQRGKKCSISGFALLSRLERNRARSAFKRFFPPRSLRRVWVLISLGQSLRVFDTPSLIYRISFHRGLGDAFFVHKSVGFFFEMWYKRFFLKSEKMPKACEICGKGPLFGQTRSHSHKASKKKWKPNLQHVKAQTKSGTKRIWVCTRCLRSGKVVKAP